MLVDPGLLEDVTGALAAFGVAAVLTAAAVAVHSAVTAAHRSPKPPPRTRRGPAPRGG
jgi:hypothetical protein